MFKTEPLQALYTGDKYFCGYQRPFYVNRFVTFLFDHLERHQCVSRYSVHVLCVEWGSTNTQCSLCENFLHTQSVKLNIMGMWEWGNYGLNEHSIYDLNGWYSFGKVSYCFGGHAQRTLVFRGVLFPVIA